MITGTSRKEQSADRSSRHRVTPSVSGSMTSRITRSNGASEKRRSVAASPLETASVSIPSRERAYSTTSRTAGSSSTMSILGIDLWQPYLGGRTFPFARTEGDSSSHPLDEVTADREPEAETPGGTLAPVEALEEVGEVFGIYPASFVLDDKRPAVHPQLHIAAALGVLHGVA